MQNMHRYMHKQMMKLFVKHINVINNKPTFN